MFAGKKSAQIREILISESTWEEMTCLFAPSLDVVEKWKKTLTSKKDDFEDFYLSDCKTREKLSFYSSHKHPKSGLPYKVRHFAVILGFAPKDKSARTAKSRK
ncbi:hypothetical protein E4J87_09665 [Escherichia coli]|nr:hypothetical protein [Escherichia coli]EGQ2047442.1 hypothetical protein [Escherichia coli]